MHTNILTETVLLGAQRHVQDTEPHLTVAARVERAQTIVAEMLPAERVDYFLWLTGEGIVASANA